MTAKQKNFLGFIYGLGSATQIRIVGAMGITELFCALIAPFLVLRLWRQARHSVFRPMLILMVLWLISALYTDFVWRNTYRNDALKGCFAIPFLMVTLICAYELLYDDLMRLKYIVVGTFISFIISVYAFQAQSLIGLAEVANQSLESVITFKTVYVAVLGAGIKTFVIFAYSRAAILVVFAQIAFGGVCLLEGSRSAFMSCLMGASGSYAGRYMRNTFRLLQNNILLFLVGGLLLATVSKAVYKSVVTSGAMGNAELEKFEEQSDSKLGLLSGRSEFFSACLAVKESPFIGHGSWPIDVRQYRRRLLEWVNDSEGLEQLERQQAISGLGLIPAHSHILQAWVWHGFLGGVFWIAVLFWLYRFLSEAVQLVPSLLAYNLMVSVSAFWSIMFSPFQNRTGWGVLLATIALFLAEVKRRKNLRKAGMGIPVNAPWDGKTRAR